MTDTDRRRAGMASKSSCSVEGCDRPYRCSGYCRLHYNRLRATGSPGGPELLYMPTVGRTCSQEGCLEPVRSLPEGVELRLRVLNRSVRLESGCIQYLGRDRAKNGYVSIGFRAKKWRVHRAMYEVSVGPIPTGTAPDGSDWTIDHLCCRVDCVNVEHMEVVSRRENLRRRTERNATREAPVPCEDCPKEAS